jgi:hypothetical protein
MHELSLRVTASTASRLVRELRSMMSVILDSALQPPDNLPLPFKKDKHARVKENREITDTIYITESGGGLKSRAAATTGHPENRPAAEDESGVWRSLRDLERGFPTTGAGIVRQCPSGGRAVEQRADVEPAFVVKEALAVRRHAHDRQLNLMVSSGSSAVPTPLRSAARAGTSRSRLGRRGRIC